jgi:hypothetical protein
MKTGRINREKLPLLVPDNLLTAHRRTPFSGARRILLAMT